MSKLIIAEKSWHFQLYRKARIFGNSDYMFSNGDHWRDPRTLCGYFWSWLVHVGVYLICQLFFYAAIAFLIALIPGLLWSWLHNHSSHAKEVLETLGIVFATLVLIIGVALGIEEFKNRFKAFSSDLATEAGALTGVGVVWNTFKSFKNKVCPLIEYQKGE